MAVLTRRFRQRCLRAKGLEGSMLSSRWEELPTGDTVKLGRSVAWNTTAQYYVGKYLWPEVEANATYFSGGNNDGKSQNFITPGLTTSRFKFRPNDERSRTGIAVGAGMQIATSQFHTYNHQFLLTSRFLFSPAEQGIPASSHWKHVSLLPDRLDRLRPEIGDLAARTKTCILGLRGRWERGGENQCCQLLVHLCVSHLPSRGSSEFIVANSFG